MRLRTLLAAASFTPTTGNPTAVSRRVRLKR
jgi:hypothetical protein